MSSPHQPAVLDSPSTSLDAPAPRGATEAANAPPDEMVEVIRIVDPLEGGAAAGGGNGGEMAAVAADGDGAAAMVTTGAGTAALVATGDGAAAAVLTAGAASAAAAARAGATAEQLIGQLRAGLRPGMAPEIQKEVAALISLISDLAAEEFNEFFPLVQIAVPAVLSDPPNLVLATRIRREIRWRTHLLLRPLLFLRSGHPAIQVILGLTTNFYLGMPLVLYLLSSLVDTQFIPGESRNTFMLVGISGAIGSIISILVRIQDFDNQEAEHRSILFFTGFFKPVIGIASALFVVVLLKAGLVPLVMESPTQEFFFFLSVGFVAGFSERLAGDIVARTEGQLAGGSAKRA